MRRNPGRTDHLLVFAAVKKMAPSSREAIGSEIPDECPFSPPSPRGAKVQKFPMHAFSLVSLGACLCATNEVMQFFVCCGLSLLCNIRLAIPKLTPNVPRVRLCSCFFIVQHSTCDLEDNAECATNEVVQFFVCCGTLVLSFGLLFFNDELVFLWPCLFRRLVRNLSFLSYYFEG